MASQKATFKGARTVQQPSGAYTVYVLGVEADERRWLVFRRYREWHRLHEQLSAHYDNVPAIPAKMLFGNMNPQVVESRARGLQTFLEACLAHVEICASGAFGDFLAEASPPKGIQQADDLRELGAIPLDGYSAHSEHVTSSSERAERAANAFIDLQEGTDPLDAAATAQHAAQFGPLIARALARRTGDGSGGGGGGGGEPCADKLAALIARPAASAADRALVKLAADALAETMAKSRVINATSNLLVKVP